MKYIFLLLILTILFSCKKEGEQVEPIEGLQIINSLTQMTSDLESGVSMVFFHASWCSVCQTQRPAISEVAIDTDLIQVFFGEVEYEDYPDIVEAHNVEGFPTMIIYKDGSEVDRFVGGGHSTSDLKSAILNQL